jgi:hypothetical protein
MTTAAPAASVAFTVPAVPPSLVWTLFARREVDPSTGCWLWTGATQRNGYGVMNSRRIFAGRAQRVHRVAAMIWLNMEPSDDRHVLHRCDIKNCFNPAHLYLGTQLDNARDAIERGQFVCGEDHHAARYTTQQVAEIRRLASQGLRPADIAAVFLGERPGRQHKNTYESIRRIIRGQRWRHAA